jgi:hypothetical protein
VDFMLKINHMKNGGFWPPFGLACAVDDGEVDDDSFRV